MRESFPIWPTPARKLLLADVLARFPELRTFQWTIREFDAVGRFPEGLSWRAFADRVRDGGYRVAGSALDDLAAGLGDLHDLDMIGTDGAGRVAWVEAFDSTSWTVAIDHPDIPAEVPSR